MTSGESGPAGPQAGLTPQAVVPQWVLPLVATMSVVIAALAVAVVQLWKKSKKAERRDRHDLVVPNYLAQGESSREEIGDGSDHFTYSKKQERVSLTR